jgi:class 3 adenylate cyclase
MLNKLRTFRERRGLSESELAGVLEASKQTVTAIERGKYDPSLPLASAIARFFRVAIEDVFPFAANEIVRTVATFVMTDIVESTELVHRLGQTYVDVLGRQRELLCDVFTDHGGRVVDDTGDANFAVFERPADAINAAMAAQRAVGAESWPQGCDLRVRIGIHTGEAYAVGNRFVGLAVHEAARVCQAAQGGQVLVSEGAAQAGGSELMVDAGTHELDGVGTRRLYAAQ